MTAFLNITLSLHQTFMFMMGFLHFQLPTVQSLSKKIKKMLRRHLRIALQPVPQAPRLDSIPRHTDDCNLTCVTKSLMFTMRFKVFISKTFRGIHLVPWELPSSLKKHHRKPFHKNPWIRAIHSSTKKELRYMISRTYSASNLFWFETLWSHWDFNDR